MASDLINHAYVTLHKNSKGLGLESFQVGKCEDLGEWYTWRGHGSSVALPHASP